MAFFERNIQISLFFIENSLALYPIFYGAFPYNFILFFYLSELFIPDIQLPFY